MLSEILELKHRKDNLAEQLGRGKEYLSEQELKLSKCLSDIELHKISAQTLEAIINESNTAFIGRIESLLNRALQEIFYDEKYSLKIITENKKLSFELIDYSNVDKDNLPLQTDVEDACGGGIMTVIGFILQLFMINLLELSNVVFIDEGFTAISSSYRPTFFEFLKEFCKETGTKIMLISHDELALEYAINVITIEHGRVV